ncbi:unnamed protein product [Acanthoscelides obtectus]|uniref:Uncharacterized protein n=1 Tax=Acanthoscelides obtectus TaxID=200917 RepID=A0A9P0Q4Q9_ACAOB|nr:unnamed protein product [Acanthoscelides obtectus]CAK1664162.1 hypothetical protein AOBTE_LOCUS24091 [Acanthoscelides obtectus]
MHQHQQNQQHYLQKSLLSLNIEKTNFMTFSLSSRTLPNLNCIKIHDSYCDFAPQCACSKYINKKSRFKYLGIIIDELLTWKDHVEYVTTKIRKLIHKFYELREILDFRTLKTVYFALTESVINYGFVVWGNTSLATLSKLQVAQKWIIKIMLFKQKRYSSELVFRDSKILNLEQLYLKSLIRFIMKYDFYKEYLQHGQNTRSAAHAKVKLQNPRHTACQSHVYCIGPKVYNDVPNSIKRLRYSTVKKELTRWIIDSPYIQYICLRYLGDPGYQQGIGQELGVRQATVSRTVDRVVNSIVAQSNEWIKFPTTNHELMEAKQISQSMSKISDINWCN